MTGAARMAAAAARRAGAGLVTVAAPQPVLGDYRGDQPGLMVQPMTAWERLLGDARVNVVVLGPGLGTGEETRRLVNSALGLGKACVLDADALNSFADDPASSAGEIRETSF